MAECRGMMERNGGMQGNDGNAGNGEIQGNDGHKYEDIIHLPHHQSTTHPHMSMYDRAAQFAPFAALTGHDAAIKETARLTDERMELDESEISLLDGQLQWIQERIEEQPEINVTYFQQDERKEGGSYRTFTGKVKMINPNEHSLVFTNGTKIRIADLMGLSWEGNR